MGLFWYVDGGPSGNVKASIIPGVSVNYYRKPSCSEWGEIMRSVQRALQLLFTLFLPHYSYSVSARQLSVSMRSSERGFERAIQVGRLFSSPTDLLVMYSGIEQVPYTDRNRYGMVHKGRVMAMITHVTNPQLHQSPVTSRQALRFSDGLWVLFISSSSFCLSREDI